MKPFIVAVFSILSLHSLAQRELEPMRQQEREVEFARREMKREELERNKIVIHYEKNTQGNYDFICENKAYCNYTVTITFTELQNLDADVILPAQIEVAPGTRTILTLRKTILKSPVHFRWHYQSIKGCPNPKVDTGYTYLLPLAPGKETRIFELSYIASKYMGESKPKDWYAIGLLMHAGDTVFASRRGRVTATSEEANLQDSGYTYAKGDNFIEIAHNDCSFARYTVFRDSSIFVHPGDWVEAGQPLGIAGGEKYAEGPHVRFSVYYHLDQDVFDKDGQKTDRVQHWAYIPINFWIKNQGKARLATKTYYTSEHPSELITQEMSKKEARKWKETHKNS